MFILKPIANVGEPVQLTGADSQDVTDLTAAQSAHLLPAIDYGMWANPDGAGQMSLMATPGAMDGVPMAAIRKGNTSGKGQIHPSAKTDAPMSNPFPGAKNSVKTSPSTIAV